MSLLTPDESALIAKVAEHLRSGKTVRVPEDRISPLAGGLIERGLISVQPGGAVVLTMRGCKTAAQMFRGG